MTTVTESGKRTIASLSAESKAIYDLISKAKIGDEITYREIDNLIGRNVRKYCRSAIDTARRMCITNDRIVFDVIKNVGLVRVDDNYITTISKRGFRQIRSTAKKYTKITLCADYDKLTPDNRLQFNYTLTGLEAMKELSSSSSESRIKSAITDKPLMVGKALELFSQK